MHISFDVFAYVSANFANISRPSQKNTAKIGYNRRKMVTCVTVDGARKDGGFSLSVDATMIRILFIDKRSDGCCTRRTTLLLSVTTSAVTLSLFEICCHRRKDHRDIFFYATLYKLYTMNTAVIYIYIFTYPCHSLYSTILAACNFIYGSKLGFVPRINFNDRFTMIIIVSTLYFISQKENIDKMYLTTVTVVLVKQEARLFAPSFCTMSRNVSLFKRRASS